MNKKHTEQEEYNLSPNEFHMQKEDYDLDMKEFNMMSENFSQQEFGSQPQSEFNEYQEQIKSKPKKSKFKKMMQYLVAGVAGATIITNTVEITTHNTEDIIQNDSVEMDNGQDEEMDILQNALNIYKSIIDIGNEIILFQTKDLEAPFCIYKECDIIGSSHGVQMILNDNSGCATRLPSIEYCQNDLIIKVNLDDQDLYVNYYKITDQGLEGFLYLRRAHISFDNQNIGFIAYYIEDGVEVHFESEEEYDSYVSKWNFVPIDGTPITSLFKVAYIITGALAFTNIVRAIISKIKPSSNRANTLLQLLHNAVSYVSIIAGLILALVALEVYV